MFRHFLTFLGRTLCVHSFVVCVRVVRFASSLFALFRCGALVFSLVGGDLPSFCVVDDGHVDPQHIRTATEICTIFVASTAHAPRHGGV